MKHLLLFILITWSGTVMAQFPWNGYILYDYLVTANHPQGCDPDYVTGLPDDSTWVNMLDFSVMTGYFGLTWQDQPGEDELLLETSYHRDNYSVRLILEGGIFSAAHAVNQADWLDLPMINWTHIFTGCSEAQAFSFHFMLPLDFALFSIAPDDEVIGIEITFLPTSGQPDLAGVYIIIPPCLQFALGPDTTICPGETIDIDATTPGALYMWQDGQTDPVYEDASPGKYWVTVTIADCIIVDTMNVYEANVPLDLGNDMLLCAGETIILDASTPGATYTWQNNSHQSTFTVSGAGTYWVSIEVADCIYADTIEIDYVVPLALDLGSDTLLCDGTTMLLDAFLPGATYEWQDNSTTSTYFVSDPGQYEVTVSVGDCSVVDVIDISYFYLDPVDLGGDVQLCDGEMQFLDAFTPGATYLWQDNSTTSSYNVDEPGNYWVIVTLDVCSTSDTIEVDYAAGFVIDLGSDVSLCTGESVTLDATTPGATYEWQDNSTLSTYTVTTPGEYVVLVDVGNCTVSDTVLVDFGNEIGVDLGIDTLLCQLQTITLDATTPGAVYLWQDNSTDSIFHVTASGMYSVQVQVGNCIGSDTIVVSYNNANALQLGNDTTLCQGESLTLNASTPGATYLWQDNSTADTLLVNQAGSYAVSVNVSGCTTVDTIKVAYLVLAAILGNDTTLCNGETLILDAQNAGANYGWQDNSTADTLLVNQAGSYWVTISLNNCSISDTIAIQYDALDPIALGNDTSLCEGATLLLNANSPGTTLQWQDNSTGPSFLVTSPGNYWVIATTPFCNTTDTIAVSYVSLSSIDLGNDTTLCEGQTLVLDAGLPGALYAWQDNSTNATYDVTQPGIYWVQANAGNCAVADTIHVSYQLLLPFDLGQDTTLCGGETITLDGFQPGASYQWQDNSTSPTLTVSQPGSYSVTVSIGSCQEIDEINVTYNNLQPIDLGNDTTLCKDETLTLAATSPGASYVWQDGSMQPDFLVSTAGQYIVIAQVDQCAVTDTINIAYLVLYSIHLGSDTTLCWGDTLTLIAAAPGAQYLWSDNSTAQLLEVAQPGSYWVRVSLAACEAADTILVEFSDPVFIDLGPDAVLCEGETLLLNAETVGAAYAWQDNSMSATFVVAQSGTYWVAVDVDGCVGADTIEVTYTLLPASLFGIDTTLCEGDELLLDASQAGASFLWQDNSTAPTFLVTHAGNYALTVSLDDCKTADTINIQYMAPVSFDLGEDKSICEGESALLDAQIINDVQYQWQDNSTAKTYVATDAGLYWLQVTDDCGARADSITIALEDCDCHMYVPNIFTPGSDGINDQVIPHSNCAVTSFVFRIYDRFGGLLFETKTMDKGWDGSVDGENAQVGVYAYVLSYQFEGKEKKIIAGDLTIVR